MKTEAEQSMPSLAPSSCHYSRGKLMITGEYLVLLGAPALAIPLRFGQDLCVWQQPSRNLIIDWETHVEGNLWFKSRFEGSDLRFYGHPQDGKKGAWLQRLLLAAHSLNPDFLDTPAHYRVKTGLNFDIRWGLGSSASLISNVATWSGTDPFALHFRLFSGSGYDIACARSTSPIIYEFRSKQLPPLIRETDFNPPFADHILFVYSGKKQDSEESLKQFNKKRVEENHLDAIALLTQKMASATSLNDFLQLMHKHEEVISQILDQPPVQKQFDDFPGAIKSLGAWGGDFLMAASSMPADKIKSYFYNKGLPVAFSLPEIIYRP